MGRNKRFDYVEPTGAYDDGGRTDDGVAITRIYQPRSTVRSCILDYTTLPTAAEAGRNWLGSGFAKLLVSVCILVGVKLSGQSIWLIYPLLPFSPAIIIGFVIT